MSERVSHPRKGIQPILSAIPAARQEAARHYGVHPYFTRRPANVVRAYIDRFTRPGDLVVDPFGGTGVTAIEALLMGRRAVHNDLNPFANFIASTMADTRLPTIAPLKEGFARIEGACADLVARIENADAREIRRILRDVPLPENIRLPKTADAEFYLELFTPRQLAGLAVIKQAVDREPEEMVRAPLLLAWSAALSKLNRTFLSAEGRAESRGGSSIFSIYRYKIAKKEVHLPIWETFRARFRNVLEGKEEVLRIRDHFRRGNHSIDSAADLQVMRVDACRLPERVPPGSVDFILTDPPYGGHIAYLDLSTLWNHWLGFHVRDAERSEEAIVGGECRLSEEHYKRKLAGSVRICVDLLKPDRWFSLVFQHWDVSYFAAILESATDAGAELKAAVTQERDVIWSMHKKKNAESVIAGEMILTFHKPGGSARHRRVTARDRTGALSIQDALDQVLMGDVGHGRSVTSEFLLNRLVLRGWESGHLAVLDVGREDLGKLLRERRWVYDRRSHVWRRGAAHEDQLELFGGARTDAPHMT